MKESMIDKQIRLEKIADLLEQQSSDNSLSDYRIMEIIGVSNGTFYKLKPKALAILKERIEAKHQLITATRGKEAIKALQANLKTKLERALYLQHLVEECESDLYKIKNFEKRIYCRKVIKDIQAEISKIEGDYITDKAEVTDDTPIEIRIGYGGRFELPNNEMKLGREI